MTCIAGQTAQNTISQQLPASATVIAPRPLNAGAFGNGTQPSLQSLLQTVSGHNIILVAYSAGHKAMQQMAQAMNPDMLKRVTDIVALESPYSGVPATINRVRQANPNVRFHNYDSGKFGGSHSTLPGNTKVASAIGGLAKAIDDGTTPPSSPLPSTYIASNPLNSGTLSPTSFFSSSQPYSGANTPYALAPQQAAPVYQTGQAGSPYTSGPPVQTASYTPPPRTTQSPQTSSALTDATDSYTTISAVATKDTSSAKVSVSATSTATKPVAATTFTDSPQKQPALKATSSTTTASTPSFDLVLMFDDIFFQMENILRSILSLLGAR